MGCGCQKCVGPSFFSPPNVESIGDTLIRIEHERLAYQFFYLWESDFKTIGQEDLLSKIYSWIKDNRP